MKIILDTNVFISGIYFSGPPSWILEKWRDKSFQIILSEQILFEYQRVAEELSYKYPQVDIAPIIDLVTIHGQLIDTKGINISICEDPDDDKFIECAVAAKCGLIISGDKTLLKLSEYKGIKILRSREFAEQYL